MTETTDSKATPLERGDAAAMERLATLPVFFKLHGKRAIVAGGSAPAVWKAELLAATGALVEIFAAAPDPELDALALRTDTIRLIRRAWTQEDLPGAALAIGAIEDEAEADAFFRAAHRAGVPVNVIDKPAFCDFQFGTIAARSPLVVGISTDGGAPVFGQALRMRIEALFPPGLGAWVQAAKDWRPAVQQRGFDFRRRRRFWETFAAMALAADDCAPTLEDQALCFAEAQSPSASPAGRLSLVGCGCGRLDALTLEAARALQAADLVVHDDDVPNDVIGFARREAGKRANVDEGATRETVKRHVLQGSNVVWVGTGDPQTCVKWTHRARYAGAGPISIRGVGECPRCAERCLFSDETRLPPLR